LLTRRPEPKNEEEKKLLKSYWNNRYYIKRKTILEKQLMERNKELAEARRMVEEVKRMVETLHKQLGGTSHCA